jgi:hypothetical protein
MHNLSFTYEKQGKYEKALPLAQQAYEGRKHVLGPDHPYTKSSKKSLDLIHSSS